MNIPPGCRYTSKTTYVDIDTGEIITKHQAVGKCTEYIIINTTKKTNYNANKTKGHIEYVKQCRRNPQRKFNFI